MYYRRAAFYYAFFMGKRTQCKGYHKQMFLVYGGKCLSRKAVYNWLEKRGRRFADDEEVEMEVRKWLRQQSKRLVLRVSTHWYVSMLVEDMSRNKCFSPGPNITCFTFYIHL
jgi:hypothetical protein